MEEPGWRSGCGSKLTRRSIERGEAGRVRDPGGNKEMKTQGDTGAMKRDVASRMGGAKQLGRTSEDD